MRSLLFAFTVFYSLTGLAQSTASDLQTELQALHTKWFTAYDNGDGATMDQMEVDNLVLVMPTGELWVKTEPRGNSQPKLDPTTQHSFRDLSVRQFGDTAILTGTLTNESKKEKAVLGTTVVFVRKSGQWKIASAQWSTVSDTK